MSRDYQSPAQFTGSMITFVVVSIEKAQYLSLERLATAAFAADGAEAGWPAPEASDRAYKAGASATPTGCQPGRWARAARAYRPYRRLQLSTIRDGSAAAFLFWPSRR